MGTPTTSEQHLTVDQLLPVVYGELHELAAGYLRRQRGSDLLGPTVIVHEAYLRLLRQHRTRWNSRAHVVAIAAKIIRRLLVDEARRKGTAKRGGDRQRVALGRDLTETRGLRFDLLDLSEALQELTRISPRRGQVVRLRFFGGRTIEETARLLDVSPHVVRRDWSAARAWLRKRLAG